MPTGDPPQYLTATPGEYDPETKTFATTITTDHTRLLGYYVPQRRTWPVDPWYPFGPVVPINPSVPYPYWPPAPIQPAQVAIPTRESLDQTVALLAEAVAGRKALEAENQALSARVARLEQALAALLDLEDAQGRVDRARKALG